jgi:N4-gp56 family major capsid protein
MADGITTLAQLIDPQVMAGMIEEKLTDLIKLSPLATTDTTLQGHAGDTVTLPKYAYIGDAEDVAEGGAIPISQLAQSSVSVKVKKAGKGGKITDESLLSGYGDPLGELSKQLGRSIASKVDNDCLAALGGIKTAMTVDVSATSIISSSVIADALVKFGEDLDGTKVLFISPAQLAQIRHDADYLKPSEMTSQAIMSGTQGEIWGCQVVVSNKIKAVSGKFTNFIVMPGALAIYLKRGVEVENARDIEHKLTTFTTDEHYVAYLSNESKAIKLITAETKPASVPSGT